MIALTIILFQSTLPLQGETGLDQGKEELSSFQSTLPLQGETSLLTCTHCIIGISIHSPSAGRDQAGGSRGRQGIISIHSPSAGRDRLPNSNHRTNWNISIHSPSAGRDVSNMRYVSYSPYFNPLSLCRERLRWSARQSLTVYFNPLSLCRERRIARGRDYWICLNFNPLSLCRERR